ncbi:MAG: HAD-IA family hydrolase [Gammaproteobacteria bacterium]|nr:HAD-IA family hydrolase [Gammaproteobacteria bacterium]MBL6998261.1 HAD-IA family hydrolase [Gammaproteobacteria bacterium]
MSHPAPDMIAFDLFGVIFSEGHLISNVLLKLLPVDVHKVQLKKAYEDFNLGVIDETEFWQAIGQTDYAVLRQQFFDHFVTDADFDAVITTLKPQYDLAILSNLPAQWADTLSQKFGFARDFSPCLFSGHLQCKKPQPEIYQKLLQQSGLRPQQIAFIDDRLENLQTAHELGLVTVYYQKDEETHPYQPDFQIHRLAQLLTLWDSSSNTQETLTE